MRILPSDVFVIHAKETIPEIKKKLGEHIDERRIFNSVRSDRQYEGEIYDNGFKVSRIIAYRNSFLPILHGSFRPSGTGTDIIIKMKLHKFVSVFMIIWILGFGLGAVSTAIGEHSNYIPLILLVIFVSIIPFAFHWERQKAKDYFNGIFNE